MTPKDNRFYREKPKDNRRVSGLEYSCGCFSGWADGTGVKRCEAHAFGGDVTADEIVGVPV